MRICLKNGTIVQNCCGVNFYSSPKCHENLSIHREYIRWLSILPMT
jgi:hypothetical protein